jgi:hypothetical protein
MSTEPDTTSLATLLRGAADGITPRPGFADDVTAGARRRLRRTRYAATGLLAVVVLAVAAGATTLRPSVDGPAGGPGEPDGLPPATGTAWLAAPTSGDLAGSDDLLSTALATWRAYLPSSPNGLADLVRGEPRVFWAGTTPVGPAAVVVQAQGAGAAAGLVAFDGDDARVFADTRALSGPAGVGFQFSTNDGVLVVLDAGAPLLLSTGPERAADGTVSRDWRPLELNGGVGALAVPSGVDPSAVRVVLADASGTPTDQQVMLLRASRASLGFDHQSKYRDERRLPWPAGVHRLPGGPPERTSVEEPLVAAGLIDPYASIVAPGLWMVTTTLANGTPVWVTEYQEGSGPSRLAAVIGDKAFDGGEIDATAVLPVRLRLPGGEGWVVARHGAGLRYRTGAEQPWQSAGADAAHLPDAATQVEVTVPGSPPQLVLLP